ncbi:MAG: Flp/Fap pilin component [Pseudomonadota bacterium]|jgi:pilus assembly protein Flp/PilA
MQNLLQRFIQDESGATMVEYAILVALVSIAAVAVLVLIGPEIAAAFQAVLDALLGV